jgi:hypothetical protein
MNTTFDSDADERTTLVSESAGCGYRISASSCGTWARLVLRAWRTLRIHKGTLLGVKWA